jgi:hypothetical protein
MIKIQNFKKQSRVVAICSDLRISNLFRHSPPAWKPYGLEASFACRVGEAFCAVIRLPRRSPAKAGHSPAAWAKPFTRSF